jgi:2-polyprenyl-3-methyl-5-hydroxy-6-metoxy-1,4-benzoquinol methylase
MRVENLNPADRWEVMGLPKPSQGCRICGGVEPAEWLYPQEMMFGLREKFAYYRCAGCDCLQIDQAPSAWDRYYPPDYYSFGSVCEPPNNWATAFKRKWLWPSMARHKLGLGSFTGRLLCSVNNGPFCPEWLRFLAGPISWQMRVLDVGCGSGQILLLLRDAGFTHLLGIDPFIPKSLTHAGGVRVLKAELSEVKGKFDLITFHHVLEHLEDPVSMLRQARQLLAPGGQILVRIPLSDSLAAQTYREHWVALDAPRHITLQTRRSMEILAQKTGMKITRVVYDSTEFQFVGSEQYLRDIPTMDPRSYYQDSKNCVFTAEAIQEFTAQSARLNAEQTGDQAAFVLVAKG